jgi:hypothetical protein
MKTQLYKARKPFSKPAWGFCSFWNAFCLFKKIATRPKELYGQQ